MAERGAIVMIYSGGNTFVGQEGLCYDSDPRCAVKLKRGTTYSALLDKIFVVMGLDKAHFSLKMTCRFPERLGKDIAKYVPLQIVDDDSVEIMLDVVFDNEEVKCISLYVETKGVFVAGGASQMAGFESGPFTSMLTQDTDVPTLHKSGPECSSPINETSLPHNDRMDFDLVGSNIDNFDDDEDVNEAMLMEESDDDEDVESDEPIGETRRECRMHEPASPFFMNMDSVDVTRVGGLPLPDLCRVWDPMQNELSKGLIFKNKVELKRAVKTYSITKHHQYEVVETNKTTWSLRCKMRAQCGCNWRLRACMRKKHKMFEITKYEGPHTCSYSLKNLGHKQLDADFIAHHIRGKVSTEPSMSIAMIIQQIKTDFQYQINYKKAWNARNKAIAMTFGDWDSSYRVLPKFLGALQKYNPGTIVKLKSTNMGDGTTVFDKVFWAFKASIDGFVHCRPVISVDATFLYGKYKGKLFIATGVDGNDQIFPLAFAIVDEESHKTWAWFLLKLRRHVVPNREGICLISDWHKDIIAAVNACDSVWKEPLAYHRFCLRHVCNNFNNEFKDDYLKKLCYTAGAARQIRKFNVVMEEIRNYKLQAWEYLNRIPQHQWALAHDDGRRYGILTTNLYEVVNGALLGGRYLPISACVQFTFHRIVEYFCVRREIGARGIADGMKFTPVVTTAMLKKQRKASGHNIRDYNISSGTASVVTEKGNVHTVNINDLTCSCGKWTIYQMPCSHMIAVFESSQKDFLAFVDDIYNIGTYQRTWAPELCPLHHEDYWDEPSGPTLCPDPRLQRAKKGRPRIRNEMNFPIEGRKTNHCGVCRQLGHDRRKCPDKHEGSTSMQLH